MAGLLQQGMGPTGDPEQPAQAGLNQPPQHEQGEPAQGSVDPRVDMDPQQGVEQRTLLVNSMLETLYGPMLDQARQILSQHSDQPEQGIGRIIGQMMVVSWGSLAEQGTTSPPGVMFQAAMVLAQAVGEMAVQLGLIDAQDGEAIEKGFMIGMGEFGRATAQQMPPEQRKRYADLIEAMRQGRESSMRGRGQPSEQMVPAETDPQMRGGV